MKKNLFIILLVFALCLTSSNVFAVDNFSKNSPSYHTQEIENGNMYTSVTETKSIAILTNNQELLIDAAIVYMDNPNTVYQFKIENFNDAKFDPSSTSFWNAVISYMENNLDNATITQLVDVTYDKPIDVTNTKSFEGAAFSKALEDLEGPEYFDAYRGLYSIGGQTIRIYESQDFRIYNDGYISWNNAITVIGVIASMGGMVATSTLTAAICGAFGVGVSLNSLLPANGRMNKYICRVMDYKYATVNGSEYVYNITDKFIDYKGYEDDDLNSTVPGQIDVDSNVTYYVPDISHFNSYTSQAYAAYDEFLRIGQQP